MKEQISLRKEDAKQFDLGDGRIRLIKQAGQHYINDKGLFKPVDTSIVANSSENGYDFSCEKIAVPFHVAANGKRRAFVKRDKSQFVEMDLPFSGLGNPTVSGNKITWDKPKFAVSIVATSEGSKMDLVLKEKPDKKTFAFPINISGRGLSSMRKFLRKPCAYDADNERVPVTYNIGNNQLVVTIDDAGKKYPITIDPQVIKQPADADTEVNSPSPDANQGTFTRIYTGRLGANIYRTIHKFDFSSDIAAGSTIDSTTLSLYVDDAVSLPELDTYAACKLTQTAWVEAEATWNNYLTTPDPIAWATSGGDFVEANPAKNTAIGVVTDARWELSIDAIVQDALDNVSGVAHILVKADNEGASGSFMWLRSNEHATEADRPKLTIDYTSGTCPMSTNQKIW